MAVRPGLAATASVKRCLACSKSVFCALISALSTSAPNVTASSSKPANIDWTDSVATGPTTGASSAAFFEVASTPSSNPP